MKKISHEALAAHIRQRMPVGMYRIGRMPTEGMYPGSIYLPVEGMRRVPWLPEVISEDMPVIVESATEEDAQAAARHYPSYAFRQWVPAAYFTAWKENHDADYMIGIDPLELSIEIRTAKETGRPIEIIDLRFSEEMTDSDLPYGVTFHPMEIIDRLDEVPKDQVYYVICDDGEASMCFATVMKRFGFHNFYPVLGGYQALQQLPAAERF